MGLINKLYFRNNRIVAKKIKNRNKNKMQRIRKIRRQVKFEII